MILFSCRVWASPGHVLDGVETFTLPNGMTFLLLSRPGAPVFSAYLRVKVGGVDEADGKTGIAHLLEHMAFKGSSQIGTRNFSEEKILLEKIETLQQRLRQASPQERVGLERQLQTLMREASRYVVKEEFSKIYQRNGATGLNATTSQDLTSYFVTLPSNKLALWAYLESQRLQDPVFREFYSERDVVMEERRMRVHDSPFGTLYEAFFAMAMPGSPYHRPTIGYEQDIRALTATDLRQFYNRYYVPGNMVVSLVGNFDLQQAKDLIIQYFGSLPAGPLPSPPQVQEVPELAPPPVVVSYDAQPAMVFGFPKPTLPHPDDYVFDVLDEVLCDGRTSRLYKTLVEEKKLVLGISCSAASPGSRLPNMFFIYAPLTPGHSAEEVLQAFDQEMEKIRKHGVSAQELQQAKKKLLAQWYYDLQGNEPLSESISYFQSIAGDWKYILTHPRYIEEVDNADLKRVVEKYLKPSRRRVGILQSNKTPQRI